MASVVDLQPDDRAVVESLAREGGHLTTLERLGLPSTTGLLCRAHAYLDGIERRDDGDLTQRVPEIWTVTGDAEIVAWGTEPRVLAIVERYIGRQVAFHGVHLRVDLPNEHQFGTLLWHKDGEDQRLVKIIVYLSDVAAENGPYEYVPASLTHRHGLRHARIYYRLWRSGHLGITDEEMERVVPRSDWKTCNGPAGTVVFTDPKAALHHGTLRSEERATLFFVYTADPPERPDLCTQYWDDTFPKPLVPA